MDKRYLTPVELIKIATEHAYSAEYLLQEAGEIVVRGQEQSDTLSSFISLMYLAFELTFKAYLLHDHNKNCQHKNLLELLEFALELGLSNQAIKQLKKLSRQYAFRKGIDYDLWENRQELHVFCVELITLYEQLQQMMPLELQKDYQ